MVGTGKHRLPIIENPSFSRIIFAINNNSLLAQHIAEKVNHDQSGLIKHLKVLSDPENDFVKIKKIKKRKYYYLNWKRIIHEYYSFIKKDLNEKYSESKALSKKYTNNKKILNVHGRLLNQLTDIKKSLITNKLLIYIFSVTFFFYNEANLYDKTLLDSFYRMSDVIAIKKEENHKFYFDQSTRKILKLDSKDPEYQSMIMLASIIKESKYSFEFDIQFKGKIIGFL